MSSPQELFEALAERFQFDKLIVDHILDAGVTSLSDFRYYCAAEAEVVHHAN